MEIIRIGYSKATSSFCKLCLTEKLFVSNALENYNCLNKKTGLVNKCRNQAKLLLKYVEGQSELKSGLNFCF